MGDFRQLMVPTISDLSESVASALARPTISQVSSSDSTRTDSSCHLEAAVGVLSSKESVQTAEFTQTLLEVVSVLALATVVRVALAGKDSDVVTLPFWLYPPWVIAC